VAEENEGPKPGHFLPGGAGADDSGAQPEARKPSQPSLGQPKSLPQASGQQGWQTARGSGPTAPFGPPPPQVPPPPDGRFSRKAIAGIVAAGLLVVGGVVFASSKVIDTFDGLVEDPLAGGTPSPSVTYVPPSEPDPTVTVTAPPAPSPEQVVRKNRLYTLGRLHAPCKEGAAHQLTSKANVQRYVDALMTCLNNAWAPVIRSAGYQFSAPKVVLFDRKQTTACATDTGAANYCDSPSNLGLPWREYVKSYHLTPAGGRIYLYSATAELYGYHVLNQVGILPAWGDLRDEAPNKATENEINRRFHLQTVCMGAVYANANRAAFPIRGQMLEQLKYMLANGRPIDASVQGSVKSAALWAKRGFASGQLSICNTWVAPAREVS